jgi:hypothetical protein
MNAVRKFVYYCTSSAKRFDRTVSGSAYKVERLSKSICSGSVMRRLYLACIDFADNAPSGHISQCKDEYEHDDDPASRSLATNYVIGCIQASNDKHAEHEKQAARDDNCSAAELVHCQESRDRYQEHEYRRDTGCKK